MFGWLVGGGFFPPGMAYKRWSHRIKKPASGKPVGFFTDNKILPVLLEVIFHDFS